MEYEHPYNQFCEDSTSAVPFIVSKKMYHRMLSFFVHICKDKLAPHQNLWVKYLQGEKIYVHI